MYYSGFSSVMELIECLSILRGFTGMTHSLQSSQQWSAVNGKSKDLVVAQSYEAGCFSWSFVEVGSNRSAGK